MSLALLPFALLFYCLKFHTDVNKSSKAHSFYFKIFKSILSTWTLDLVGYFCNWTLFVQAKQRSETSLRNFLGHSWRHNERWWRHSWVNFCCSPRGVDFCKILFLLVNQTVLKTNNWKEKIGSWYHSIMIWTQGA